MRRGSEARGTTSKVSRGTDANIAYVFTRSPKLADPVPSPRAAPELARYDRRTTEPGHQLTPKTETSEAIAVLAAVLDRDGQQLSATQTRHQALSDADHLALLHAIWTAETTPARHQRYTDLLTSTLPPGYCTEDLAAGHRTFADRLADRQSQRIPSEDPDYGDLGPAFPAWPGPGQDAILQPPKPEIPPSPQVLQRATDRDADYEAAD